MIFSLDNSKAMPPSYRKSHSRSHSHFTSIYTYIYPISVVSISADIVNHTTDIVIGDTVFELISERVTKQYNENINVFIF